LSGAGAARGLATRTGPAAVGATTGVAFSFATPHHSWERGTNENTNGLSRQYLPKRTRMASVTQAVCNAIASTTEDDVDAEKYEPELLRGQRPDPHGE
jgi:hypothetical protein